MLGAGNKVGIHKIARAQRDIHAEKQSWKLIGFLFEQEPHAPGTIADTIVQGSFKDRSEVKSKLHKWEKTKGHKIVNFVRPSSIGIKNEGLFLWVEAAAKGYFLVPNHPGFRHEEVARLPGKGKLCQAGAQGSCKKQYTCE